jgi:putative sporulation protein YtaF
MRYGAMILLGIVANLDNLFLGFIYGMHHKKITWVSNLVISLITGIATFLPCFLGSLASAAVSGWAGIVGGAVLCASGAWMLIDTFREARDQEASVQDTGEQGGHSGNSPAVRNMKFRDMLTLGVALGLNCVVLSLGAGVAGINSFLLAAAMALFSFGCIWLGNHFGIKGRSSIRLPQRLIGVISSLLVISLGIFEMLS